MLKSLLRNKQGEISIQMLLYFPCLVLAIVIAINVGGQLHIISELDRFADEMATAAAREGKCKGEFLDRQYELLSNATGLSPQIEYDAPYYDTTNLSVQYGDPITVTVTLQPNYNFYGNKFILMSYSKKATRQSFQYHKKKG